MILQMHLHRLLTVKKKKLLGLWALVDTKIERRSVKRRWRISPSPKSLDIFAKILMKNFNLSKDEKEDIVKKMTELLELCQIYHCPMFATVAVSNNQIKTEYENICFGSNANQISLTDDQIRQHILIAGSDFVAVPKRDSVEMNMSKLPGKAGKKGGR